MHWDDPADAELAWRQEHWHNPDPAPPLVFAMLARQYAGFRRGVRAAGRPAGPAARLINGYFYTARRPFTSDDPPPLGPEPQPPFEENHRTWDEVWLPAIQSYLARWEAFDREHADAGQLLTHLEDSLLWLEHCWEMHTRVDFRGRWPAWCERVLGWTPEQARELVVGEPNKSLEGDAALRALAVLVRTSDTVSAAFARPAGEVLASLAADGETAGFRAAFAAYLDRFGRRSDNWADVSLPTWQEAPLPVVALIKMYAQRETKDAAAEHAALLQRRDAATSAARAELAARAPELLDEFDWELAHGRRCAVLNEDHNYWLDQQSFYWMRRDLVAAGSLLQRSGAISARDDVFFLTFEELRSALTGAHDSLHALVEARRADLDHWRGVTPPLELGMPMDATAAAQRDLLFGAIGASGRADQIKGQAASRGMVTGRARIITTLSEADRLLPGEIMVVKTTTPPWTPLFGVAAGIVTDAGGALSHAAIVAREYGIPAVVGTVNATTRITDGQLLRIDGAAGTVDLLGGE